MENTIKDAVSNISSIQQAESFLGGSLPKQIRDKFANKTIIKMADQDEIIKTIDFEPPFLRTDKVVLFKDEGEDTIKKSGIGIGKVYLEDTRGHYNSTIYLALAGRLMPSTASIFLALLFPGTAPQAIEGKSIRMAKNVLNKGLLKPSKKGTTFFVEVELRKKKLQLALVNTKIFFGQVEFGLIEELVFVLTNKESIWSAIDTPEVI